ncbi:MAG: hypothetical protein ACR2NS_15170 [Gemmatimonadaceae bacterium]
MTATRVPTPPAGTTVVGCGTQNVANIPRNAGMIARIVTRATDTLGGDGSAWNTHELSSI